MEDEKPVRLTSRFQRRAYALLILAILLIPFGLVTAYQRAIAVRDHQLISMGEAPGPDEGFEILILYLYLPFVFITTLWLAYMFFSRHQWKRSEFGWQAAVVVILGVLPSIGVNFFFVNIWPTLP